MADILQITIILAASLFATIIAKRLDFPAVVGQMVVGVLIGPQLLGWVHGGHTIEVLSEIGVILLMFLAGLESDLTVLRKHFKLSLLIAIAGVVVPLAVFWGAAELLGYGFSVSFFYGIVFAATSVSITVEVLQEFGKLSTRAGSIILGAAVVDDILAVLLLSIFTSSKNTGQNIWLQIALEVAFLGFLVLVHLGIPRVWKFVDRLPIFAKNTTVAMILCLALSLLSHEVGLSAVIGSFFAGLAISQTSVSHKIEEYISTIGYVFFIPIFFVSIAVSISLDSIWEQPLIIVLFVVLAILTKFLPGFGVAKLGGLTLQESSLIGTGMISRGEMALIVAQIGLTSKVISDTIYSELVIVILLTTLIAPFLIKLSIGNNKKEAQD